MWIRCPQCGSDFYQDAPWKKICLSCWQENKRREQFRQSQEMHALISQIYELQDENERLRMWLEAPKTTGIEDELFGWLRRLISLTHPDKHGGSEVAKEATIWLLSLKEKAAMLAGEAA